MLAALLISGRDWLLPAAGFLGLTLLVLFWTYRTGIVDLKVRFLCGFLKLLGILALAFCLLDPLWTGDRARPGANFFAILADNSQGMQIKDRNESRSRGDLLHAALTSPQASWQASLEENFQVRRYVFDSRVQATKDFTELTFDGRSSAIGTALKAITDRYKGQPLAGVLLFSDGNATDIAGSLADYSGLPPIYPVVIGRDEPIKDIAINKVTVSQTAFEDAPVTIQAEVNTTGYSGINILAQLLEVTVPSSARQTSPASSVKTSAQPSPPSGQTNLSSVSPGTNAPLRVGVPPDPAKASAIQEKIVAEQTERAPREGETLPFRFQIRPWKTGINFYRLRVSARDEIDQFENTKSSTEATLANNSRLLVVDRGKGPYRILYVAGRPNWEYKFLNRALSEDEQVQLVGLIRIAKREPKFDFRGRAGESSNPLFRGFGNQSKEEIERYDQPVLVRIYPTEEVKQREESKLSGGFPKTAEDLFTYQAVILDDLEAEFFTPDQMALLQKFVSERGGGFMMLGGQESFQQGKFQRTPIGDMLPVYLDQSGGTAALSDLRLNLTKEGWLQPWVRLRNNELDEKARLDALPPFQVLNQIRGVKPGASVVATVSDPSGNQYPALAVQRFGNGRTAALTIGDFWRFGLQEESSQRDLAKAWRQIARWLVADVPNLIDLQTEQKDAEPNQPVVLQVRVRDPKFQPLESAAVSLTIDSLGQRSEAIGADKPPTARSIRLNAEPALSEAGLYEATYIPRETGGYYVETIVTNAMGVEVGRAESGWTSDPAAEEFRSLKPNHLLMATLAKKTGGEVIPLSKMEEFVANLPRRQAPIRESWSFPLWHQPAVFLLALLCFAAEWGLRRWKGLA